MEKLADISAFEGLSDQNGMMIHNFGGTDKIDLWGYTKNAPTPAVGEYIEEAAQLVRSKLWKDFYNKHRERIDESRASYGGYSIKDATADMEDYLKKNKDSLLQDFYANLIIRR